MIQSKEPSFLIKKYRSILKAALVVEAASCLVSFTDSLVSGNMLGGEALSAVAIVSPVMSVGTFISCVINSGTLLDYSYNIGKGDTDRANKVFGQGVLTAVVSGTALLLILLLCKDFFLRTMGCSEAMAGYVNDYYKIIIIYLALDPLSCVLDNVMVCDGGESVSAAANTTEIIGNVLLSIAFTILWGIKGLAFASVLCKLIFFAIVLIWYIRHSHVRLTLYFETAQFLRMCKNGLVKASTFAFSALMFMILNSLYLSQFGEESFTLLAVAERFMGLSALFLGLASAMQPLVCVLRGERNTWAQRRFMRAVNAAMIQFGLVASVITIIFAPLLIRMFGITDSSMVERGTLVLRLIGISLVFVSVAAMFFSYYYLMERSLLALTVSALKDLALPVACAYIGIKLLASPLSLWLLIDLSQLLAVVITMAIVFAIYGKSRLPWLLSPDEESGMYCYDFEITEENAVDLSKTIMELVSQPGTECPAEQISELSLPADNSSGGTPERGHDLARVGKLAGFFAEEILMSIKDNNPPGETIDAELMVIRDDDGVQLIIRDSGVLFDITESDCEMGSFRNYIISRTINLSEYKSYTITTGYNRNEVYLNHEPVGD